MKYQHLRFQYPSKSINTPSVPHPNSNENEANRDPVLQDQKVLPEIRNRPFLLRDFLVIQSTEIPLEIHFELSPYVIKYVITYATTCAVTYAISQAITYVITYVITYLISYAITYAMTYAIMYVIAYVITYARMYAITHAITFAITYVLTYAITYVTTCAMTDVHPNLNSISSAKPHPQPPYQALAWSHTYIENINFYVASRY